jgi:hypothetical protein
VGIGSQLRLRLSGIEKSSLDDVLSLVGKLIDVAHDSGASLTPGAAGAVDYDEAIVNQWGFNGISYSVAGGQTQSGVRFALEELKDVREKLYADAVADARRRAERLAKLNGVKLGQVLAVDEQILGGEENRGHGDDSPRVVVATPIEAVYTVKVAVRYAIEPAKQTRSSTGEQAD